MGKDPEKLFEKISKEWGEDNDHNKALEGYENVLLLLGYGEYDNLELKNPYDGEYNYDNLTQKVHVYRGMILMSGKNLFKEGMLEFDKAIQINPENKDVLKGRIKTIEFYSNNKKKKDGRDHPELTTELIKCCDKLLSVDNKNFYAWLQKSIALRSLERYEDSLECEDVILRLIPEQGYPPETRTLTLHTKATCYYFMNRPTEAKKCLLEILELDPYNEEALADLHDIEKKDGLAERVARTEKNNISSQESESNFCDNCGKSLKKTAKFCGKCGNKV